jgi:hypothetical protein
MMSQGMNNFRTSLSAGNHGYSFWDEKDFLLKKFLLRGKLNSYCNVERVRTLECLH